MVGFGFLGLQTRSPQLFVGSSDSLAKRYLTMFFQLPHWLMQYASRRNTSGEMILTV